MKSTAMMPNDDATRLDAETGELDAEADEQDRPRPDDERGSEPAGEEQTDSHGDEPADDARAARTRSTDSGHSVSMTKGPPLAQNPPRPASTVVAWIEQR